MRPTARRAGSGQEIRSAPDARAAPVPPITSPNSASMASRSREASTSTLPGSSGPSVVTCAPAPTIPASRNGSRDWGVRSRALYERP